MDELNLELTFSLADVAHKDRDLYREVCQSYFDLYGVAIKVFDDNGSILFEVPGPSALCQYCFKIPPCRQACIHLVNTIRRDLPPFQTVQKTTCFTGAEYRVAPIHYGTDVVGKVLFGPFLPPELRDLPAEFLAMDRSIDSWEAWEAAKRFRRINPRLADQIAKNLATVIEVMAFVGFKGLMTTNMHVQSLSEAFEEINQKNQKLESQIARLRELNNQRASFLAAISKEIKAPLTSLIGYAEMLQEGVGGALTEDQKEFLKTIIDQGESLFAITQTIEELSRIERGQVEITPKPVAVVDLLDRIVRQGKRLGAPRDIQVKLIPLQDPIPDLFVDPDKVHSILQRIMNNAVKFTPSGGHIEVSARDDSFFGATHNSDNPAVAISIQDTGIGIPPEHVGQIFDPFFTVHRGPEHPYSGTGVGLAIAKAYTDAHAGRILVQSTPGQGTTVTVFLPTEPPGPLEQ
ncbi:MAG: PocR ligand-binding domain-containing protein [Bradymonadales bacterium]|nr:PocR ligand-binding domain-containing protein [Bradymonadales bacterium]